jgi:hypothetical protein
MTQARCVERLWLAMALAQRWCLSVGCRVEQQEQEHRLRPVEERLPEKHVARRTRARFPLQCAPRRVRCVVRGRLHVLALAWLAHPLALGCLVPQAWPAPIDAPQKPLAPALRHGTKTPGENARRRRQKQRSSQRSKAVS